jgi:hypothetical protein
MAAVSLASSVPAVRDASRLKTAAAWLFLLPVFTEGVLPGVVKLEFGGLAVLLAVGSSGPLPPRAVMRAFPVFAVLVLTVIAYLYVRPWPAGTLTASLYGYRAGLFVITYAAVAVYAAFFFCKAIFARVMWRASIASLAFSEVASVASRVTGHLLLVNDDNGLRMTGTMGEPSDWAPVITVVLLLGLRRRSWPAVALACAGMALADSPTCILVAAVSGALWYALAGSWQHKMLLLAALAMAIPVVVILAARTPPPPFTGSPARIAAERLLSGIRSVETGGTQGQNSRYDNTEGVLEVIRDDGWMRAGAGPGADAAYFAAYPPPPGVPSAVNALWVSVLFCFGEWGLALLAIAGILAAWRIRRNPQMAALLLPFMVASMVNSAIPDWSLAALGILLFACGWVPREAPADRSPGMFMDGKPQGSELSVRY